MRVTVIIDNGCQKISKELVSDNSEYDLKEIISKLSYSIWSELFHSQGILIQSVNQWVKAIRIVRKYSGLGLKETKDLVLNPPFSFLVEKNMNIKECLNELHQIGCNVMICSNDDHEVLKIMRS